MGFNNSQGLNSLFINWFEISSLEEKEKMNAGILYNVPLKTMLIEKRTEIWLNIKYINIFCFNNNP